MLKKFITFFYFSRNNIIVLDVDNNDAKVTC